MFNNCKSRWSKKPQWENDCGFFRNVFYYCNLDMMLVTFIISLQLTKLWEGLRMKILLGRLIDWLNWLYIDWIHEFAKNLVNIIICLPFGVLYQLVGTNFLISTWNLPKECINNLLLELLHLCGLKRNHESGHMHTTLEFVTAQSKVAHHMHS